MALDPEQHLQHIGRDANRIRSFRKGAIHRLSHPPIGISAQGITLGRIEHLDPALQADCPLLDQILKGEAHPAVLFGDGDAHPHVSCHQSVSCPLACSPYWPRRRVRAARPIQPRSNLLAPEQLLRLVWDRIPAEIGQHGADH